jgi:hypothetical protein
MASLPVVALTAALLLACGAAPVAESSTAVRSAADDAPIAIAGPSGDLLLARARLSIENGVLAPELEQRILASTAPEHAHAQRLLQAMRDGVAEPAGDDADPADPLAVAPVPAVAPVAESPATPKLSAPVPGAATEPTVVPSASRSGAAAPAAAKLSATLDRISMRATDRGATLSIHASSGVLVGVANQPGAGIVRLVLDDVRAVPSVLSSRPGAGGARVRDVAKSGGGVRITLALEPGWRFGGVHRTGKGATVELLGP